MNWLKKLFSAETKMEASNKNLFADRNEYKKAQIQELEKVLKQNSPIPSYLTRERPTFRLAVLFLLKGHDYFNPSNFGDTLEESFTEIYSTSGKGLTNPPAYSELLNYLAELWKYLKSHPEITYERENQKFTTFYGTLESIIEKLSHYISNKYEVRIESLQNEMATYGYYKSAQIRDKDEILITFASISLALIYWMKEKGKNEIAFKAIDNGKLGEHLLNTKNKLMGNPNYCFYLLMPYEGDSDDALIIYDASIHHIMATSRSDYRDLTIELGFMKNGNTVVALYGYWDADKGLDMPWADFPSGVDVYVDKPMVQSRKREYENSVNFLIKAAVFSN